MCQATGAYGAAYRLQTPIALSEDDQPIHGCVCRLFMVLGMDTETETDTYRPMFRLVQLGEVVQVRPLHSHSAMSIPDS